MDGHDRRSSSLTSPAPDLEVRTDLLVVSAGSRGLERMGATMAERHVLQTRHVAEALEDLEQHRQREGGQRPARRGADDGQILDRRVSTSASSWAAGRRLSRG